VDPNQPVVGDARLDRGVNPGVVLSVTARLRGFDPVEKLIHLLFDLCPIRRPVVNSLRAASDVTDLRVLE
jgi:hypothetical protein